MTTVSEELEIKEILCRQTFVITSNAKDTLSTLLRREEPRGSGRIWEEQKHKHGIHERNHATNEAKPFPVLCDTIQAT